MAKDRGGKAKKGNIPGWLQLRIDNGQATKEDKALYEKLMKAKAGEGPAVKGQEVCPGCQSTSICPGGCVGGCQSNKTGGCTSSCLLPGL
jgi:hypothetical protein